MKEMPKWKLFIAMAALFLSTMCTMGDTVITPIVAALYSAFADEPEAIVNFAITGPSLIGIPFGLVAGVLCDRFNKKWVMVGGFAVFTVCAVFGATTNVYLFTVLRCFATGVAWGLTNTAALAILADMFPDDDEHAKMVGWYDAAMAIVGAVMPIAAGALAVGSWQHSFYTYWVAVPVLVLLVLFLPSMPRHDKRATEEDEEAPAEEVQPGWWKKLIPLTVQVLLIGCNYFVALYMISVFIVDGGIGNEAVTGTVSAVAGLVATVSALIFGAVYKKMKNFVYIPFLFIIGLSFIAMALFPNIIVSGVCMALIGFSWPFYFCYYYVHATELVPASKAGIATGVVALAEGIACTACSYYLMAVMGFTDGDVVKAWPVFGVVIIVVTAISAVSFFANRKKNAVSNN